MNTKSAIISPYSKTFYPPHKLITFNGHLKNNDGLLANYIASVDKVPYDSAMNFIKFEVNEWRDKIKNSDLLLEQIGKFSLDNNDSVIFEPQTDINYLTTSFGLTSFVTPDIKRESDIKPVVKLEEKAPVVIADRKKEENNYLKYAAIFVIGFSLLALGGNTIYKNYKNKQLIVAAQKQHKQIENKIEQATFIVTEALPSITLNVSIDRLPFHVIAGAYRYPENAVRKVNQLKAMGYKARILGINQWGLTQVSFDSYQSREDAINNLYRIRKSEDEDAWLLVQDL